MGYSIDLNKQPSYMSVNELRREVVASRKRIRELEEFIEEIDHQYEAMQRIKAWCDAYPVAVFPEPDWVEVKDKLGNKLTSRVGASNMRYVVDGIKRIITECEQSSTQ
jgi:kynureninase